MAEQTDSRVPQIRFKGFEGEWVETALATACSLLTGNPFESKEFSKSGVLLVRGMNVKRGFLDTSKRISEYLPSSLGYETFLLEEDDIVIQMDGALIGKSYARIRKEHLPALLVQRVTRVRCKNRPISDFLYQYIQRDFLSYIQKSKTETAVPHLSLDDIRTFPVAVSSPEEQTQIGGYFKELDGMIGLHQRKHGKLVTLKQAMLQKMFPQNGATAPEIRFKGFSEPWVEKTIAELGDVVTGSTPSTQNQTFYSKKGMPWVTPTDIKNNVTTDSSRRLSAEGEKVARIVSADTILVTCIASIGKNTLLGTKGSFNQQINGIVPDKEKYVPYFLFTESAFWSQQIKSTAASGTMQIVNKAEFSAVKTRIPTLPEQQKIGTYFRQLDTLITKHATQLEKLKQLKSACLEKMFV